MAFTVTDFSGLGPGLQSIANIFANQQTSAVEADLKRNTRDNLIATRANTVADTALKEQDYKRVGANMLNAQELEAALANPDGFNMRDVLANSVSYNNAGNINVMPGAEGVALQQALAPTMVDPLTLSLQMAPGVPWQNTPAGVTQALGANSQLELNKLRLTAALGGKGGAGGNSMNITPEMQSAFEQQADRFYQTHFPGQVVPPQVKDRLVSEAAEWASQNGSVVGAVENAAGNMQFDTITKEAERPWYENLYRTAMWLSGRTDLAPGRDQPTTQREVNISGVNTDPRELANQLTIQELLASMGAAPVVEGLPGSPAALPGGAVQAGSEESKQQVPTRFSTVQRDANGMTYTPDQNGVAQPTPEGTIAYSKSGKGPDYVMRDGQWTVMEEEKPAADTKKKLYNPLDAIPVG